MATQRSSRTADATALAAEIICPQCASTLDAAADGCPYCGCVTTAAPPPARVKPLIDRPWLIALAILHVGVLGIPLYWKTSYSLSTRLLLVGVSIVYTIVAVAGIAWGGWQIWRVLQGL